MDVWTTAQYAAALALFAPLQRLLGWPLAAALTLLWLSAAEGAARRRAVQDARRAWQVRLLLCRRRSRPARAHATAGGARRAGAGAT